MAEQDEGRLWFTSFLGAEDPLGAHQHLPQVQYIRRYLFDLDVRWILVEPHYFDRDWLAEFAAFYGVSAAQYPNLCARLHFFTGKRPLKRQIIEVAATGNTKALNELQERYAGFLVLRPLPCAPLGRTVLAWYPERSPSTPRVTSSRRYQVHIAGLELQLEAVAWQQQDGGVAACATIALWTMFHSSALNRAAAVPTTAEITRLAHAHTSFGRRLFPANDGLFVWQILGAIKEMGLSPVLCQGDMGVHVGFTREIFNTLLGSLLRAGYPVLTLCSVTSDEGSPPEQHVVCVVGFREVACPQSDPERVLLIDAGLQTLYVHDDNLGPSVRFQIEGGEADTPVHLRPVAPVLDSPRENPLPDPCERYAPLVPTALVVAVHDDLRTHPSALQDCGSALADTLCGAVNEVLKNQKQPPLTLNVSTRFIRLTDYVGGTLQAVIGRHPQVLGRVRLTLWEEVPPMSLHLGLLRVLVGQEPRVDVLYDTTDADGNLTPFCYVAYSELFADILEVLTESREISSAVTVRAWA